MNLRLFIAKRYLLAKKSQQVINIISMVSAAGIALGTMALIVVLSVYNGFDKLIIDSYNAFDSDLLIKPATGKTFVPQSGLFSSIEQHSEVAMFCPVIKENVFLQYRNRQAIATIKGIDSLYLKDNPLTETATQGKFDIWFGEVEEAVVGRGLAFELGINVNFLDPLWVYFPNKSGNFSAINPYASLNREKLFPAGIFSVEQNFDSKYLFAPREMVARLLDYEDEVSHIEIRLHHKKKVKRLQKVFAKQLGSNFTILNRFQQNETLFKMMKTEKMVIYLILTFIVIIICCNVLSSISLLIIEKDADINIMRSLGATDKLIRQTFMLEGWLISLCGMVAGLIIGLVLCLLQSAIGIIPMPGNFAISYYPVIVSIWDILLVIITVAALGALAAYIPSRKI